VEIAGEDHIAQFASRFPGIKNALDRWASVVEQADWKNPAEMKKTFRRADVVGKQTVFDIGGNKCRLIAIIHYSTSRVLVQHVLTHHEYDRGRWKHRGL
jgi:mRNA interferase HigB